MVCVCCGGVTSGVVVAQKLRKVRSQRSVAVERSRSVFAGCACIPLMVVVGSEGQRECSVVGQAESHVFMAR